MNIVLEYDFADFHGNYCQRQREFYLKRQATLKETREATLDIVYKVIPASVSWHVECSDQGKTLFKAWGYGHSLEGYTTYPNY